MPTLHSVGGTIWSVFGHRLAIEGPEGRALVDLGPDGAKALARASVILKVGDAITVTGERKSTEIKAAALVGPDGTRHAITRHRLQGGHEPPADPSAAIAALQQAGYVVEGAVKRKPKHFEIDARKDGGRVETHVTFAGEIRKTKCLPDSKGISDSKAILDTQAISDHPARSG